MATVENALQNLSEQEYKRRIRAWTLYDWANSAFATTILAAVLPAYYSAVAGSTLPSAATATQYWNVTLSVSVLIVALMSPVLGTVSDLMRGKKKFLSLFVGIGVIGTGLLVLVDSGDWFMASLFFVIGRIGFGAANVFYDSLLPHVARDEDQDRVSSQGYALGYLGGGLLLAINVVMIFTLPGNWGIRLSMFTVAIWWAVFSIPLLLRVPEPAGSAETLAPGQSLVRTSFRQIWDTLRNIRDFKDLFRFLIAFLIYNDGIGIIISVAVIYGAELGFATTELILAILLVQFVGIPYSLVFGGMPSKTNKRQAISVAFILFNIVALPIVALAGKSLLPKSITGTPSPPFETTGAFVGEGSYVVNDGAGFGQADTLVSERIPAALVGESCSWYAFWCDETSKDQTYMQSAESDAALDFTFVGQQIVLTHSTGPDHGTWSVLMDGAPLTDADGEPIVIDAYNNSLRYAVQTTLTAEDEGQHTLTLQNGTSTNDAGSGSVLSVYDVTVKPPLRTSNLGAIIGLVAGVVLLSAALAWLTGDRFFSGIAERLDTKGAIQIALLAYCIIAIWGFFLNSVIEYWFLAWMVATSQGGSQALSRSVYASMTPTSKSGEFFGFFSIMSKFASFLSPLVFILSVALFDSSRPGILSLIAFFVIGMVLLRRVDVEAGKKLAQEIDAATA